MAEKSRSAEAEQTQANEVSGAVYEIGFHVVPTLSEADAAAVLERIKKALERAEASIIAEETPKRMTFAYRIERSVQGKREKFTEGYFGWVKFEIESEHINSLEEMLRADREILRHLLIHTTRESVTVAPRAAVYSSDRLEGEIIAKPVAVAEEAGPVSEEELDKSLEALVGDKDV